jgi:hypothetical protein
VTIAYSSILDPVSGRSQGASAYYSASVERFLASDRHHVLGVLTAAHAHDLEVDQRQAREEEIDILRSALSGFAGTLYLEQVQWFLNDRHDTRSSYYLEDAATEFQVQGLVTWDADLRRHAGSWRYHSFRGDAWTSIHKEERKRYLLNAYRVLLTRARQGMVIFVPPGDESGPTRAPAFYNETYEYLAGLGVVEL